MPQDCAHRPWRCSDRIFLGVLLAVALVIGALGIARLSYIGQDFDGPFGHNYLIRSFPETYSYALTNPPGLYWLGHLIFSHLTTVYYLEILAGVFLLLNLTGLWVFFGLIREMIAARPLRWAAAVLVTLVPFRTIHAIVIAADAFTFPAFAVIAVLALRLQRDPRLGMTWGWLGTILTVALLCKYTFAGMLPPLALVLGLAAWRMGAGPDRRRVLAYTGLALGVPALVFLFQLRASQQVHGITTETQWKAQGTPAIMRWSDLLLPQRSDAGIFSAPRYFQDRVYETRKYSYPALVHLTAFTDAQDYFQKPPAAISAGWRQRAYQGFLRERTPWAQALEQWAVAWCVPDSLGAIAAALGLGLLSAWQLVCPRPGRLPTAVPVATALAWGYHGLIFFSLPWLGDPYTPGYWLPRLDLPALATFLVLGFVVAEQVLARTCSRPGTRAFLEYVLLAHTLVAGGFFLGFLA